MVKGYIRDLDSIRLRWSKKSSEELRLADTKFRRGGSLKLMKSGRKVDSTKRHYKKKTLLEERRR